MIANTKNPMVPTIPTLEGAVRDGNLMSAERITTVKTVMAIASTNVGTKSRRLVRYGGCAKMENVLSPLYKPAQP